MKITWNVFLWDINRKEIKEWDVFNHGRFGRDVAMCLRDCRGKDEFKEELRREILYYFGFKVEYETYITEPFPYITKKEMKRIAEVEKDVKYQDHVNLEYGSKIDVYRQIMMNYDRFVDYLWQNKERMLEEYA